MGNPQLPLLIDFPLKKKMTSRRLSHLETGNFIRFSYYTKEGYSSLRETELIYGYSKIKESPEKLDALYLIIFILNKILPEDQEEYEIYTMTHKILKELNNRETTMKDVEKFVMSLLEKSGFIDEKIKSDKSFDAISFVEELIGQKI